MHANGSPKPVFEFDEDYTYFMVRLPIQPAALAEAKLAWGQMGKEWITVAING